MGEMLEGLKGINGKFTKTIEDKIDACDTLAKFIALFDVPSDGKAPIYDFPDEVS